MNHCKDCKWWIQYTKSRLFNCTNPKLFLGEDTDTATIPDDGIYIADDINVDAVFTGPEFGCVNFEAKETPYTTEEVWSSNEVASPGKPVSKRPDDEGQRQYMTRFN